jgi:PAS domain S-box-containing protein
MKIQYVNEAFTDLTGYTLNEVLGRSVSFMARSETPDRVANFMDTVVERGQLWYKEVKAQRKDGRKYDAMLTISPMHNEDGELIGFVASHRDISQERELERARNRFMTHVSHQLRTPVTNLKLYAQMLRKGVAKNQAEQHLQVLEEQSLRLSELVQDILEITALDAGQAIRTWEIVSLFSLIKSVVGNYQERARAAGLTVEITSLPPNLPKVSGDSFRLGQALGEVLLNAITFTPPRGRVTVFVETASKDGRSWVTIAISDTGPGIPEDEQEKVFERFFRGRITDSGHVTGSGLGLSLADEIVRAHGGQMTLESRVGHGSTFTIWLMANESQGELAHGHSSHRAG